MIPRKFFIVAMTASLFLPSTGGLLQADEKGDPALHKAYFLEKEAGRYVEARKLYNRILAGDVKGDARRTARAGRDRCRDRLAAEDFASIMPDETTVYVEIRRPGEILGKLCGMLGMRGEDVRAALDKRPSAKSAAPFHIPKDFVISPAIFEYLEGFGGGAVAITKIRPNGPPDGVLAIHHGDTQLLKGLLETAFQFSPTAEKIRGLPTFGADIEGVTVTGVLTESLLIVGTGRDLVDGVVARLLGKGTSSLASREDLKEMAARRKGATLFAYVDIQRVLSFVKEELPDGDRREMAIADAFVDLDSLRWATFSFGIDEGVLGVELAVRLADDHRNLVYNLMRMPPMTRQCLEHVPADAAGFIGLGLNPVLVGAVANQADAGAISGFDIGREFFGNIRELCAFVVPGNPGKGDSMPLPNAALVMAVNNPAKSKALWNQLLSIPNAADTGEVTPPKTITLDGAKVSVYKMPKVGNVYFAELDDCIAIGLTRASIRAAVRAKGDKGSILSDPIMSKAINDVPKDSSFMIVAHAGRLAKVGGAMAPHMGEPETGMAANYAAEFCDKMVLWAGIGQSPNQFTIRAALSGLPDVGLAMQKFAPLINTVSGFAMQRNVQARSVIVEQAAQPDEGEITAASAGVNDRGEGL